MEPPGLAAEELLGPGHGLGQGVGPVALGDVVEPGPEGGPVVLDDVLAGELPAGLEGELVELGLVDLLEGGADDLALGQQAGVGQPEQPGQQLAARQVAGGPEQHDDVGQQGRRIVDGRATVGSSVVRRSDVGDGGHGVSPSGTPLFEYPSRDATDGMFRFRVGRESGV